MKLYWIILSFSLLDTISQSSQCEKLYSLTLCFTTKVTKGWVIKLLMINGHSHEPPSVIIYSNITSTTTIWKNYQPQATVRYTTTMHRISLTIVPHNSSSDLRLHWRRSWWLVNIYKLHQAATRVCLLWLAIHWPNWGTPTFSTYETLNLTIISESSSPWLQVRSNCTR